jgi:hypothetical protein
VLVGDQVLSEYDGWLERQVLAVRTRSAYRRWVQEFVEHLEVGGELERFLGADGEHDRRSAVADWRRRLVDRRLAPSTVNLALAAVTSLLDSRALRSPAVPRVEVDPRRRAPCRSCSFVRCSARAIGCRRAATERSCSC